MIKIALKDRKINSWSKPVTSLEDKPKMTAAELKAAFDSNSNQIKPAINNIIDDLTGVNGASDIGVSAIDSIDGATVQAVLNSLATLSKSNRTDIDNLSTANGAGKIGLNSIDGIDGTTVQAVLNSIATLSKSNRTDIDNLSSPALKILSELANKNRSDIDVLSTSAGAGKIGISPIKELQGSNLQEIIQNIWKGVMQIETGDPNEFQYIKKTDKGIAGGVASLGEDAKLEQTQIPTTITDHITNKSNPHSVTASQVGAYTKTETLASSTASLFGLSASATPDDVLKKTKTLIDTVVNNKTEVVAGSYTGDATYDYTHRSKTINLGSQPKAVLVITATGQMYYSGDLYGGLALQNNPCKHSSGIVGINVTSDGFIVSSQRYTTSYGVHVNDSNSLYYYLAFK